MITTARPNLVLISLDTLRADVAYSGRYPALERLRKLGTSFLSTVSAAPITPVSHATILTGRNPPSHGIRHLLRKPLRPDVPTLASVLRASGYATGGIVSCPGMNGWYGFDRGFDHYDDWVPPLPDGRNPVDVVDVQERGVALKRAPMVVERALGWLSRQRTRPLFLFVHFFDSHWPYEPPETFGIAVSNPYEGEVAYMDHHLGLLLDGISARGLTEENTVICCLSDHGEDLGGWYTNDHTAENAHPEERGHGALLYDTTQLVPLIIAARGVHVGNVVDQVRLVDVFATCLDLIGVAAPPNEGMSLLPALQGVPIDCRVAYSEAFYREELAELDPRWSHLLPLKSVREPGRKIIWEHGGEYVEAYNLEVDPEERVPISIVEG